MKTKQQIGIWSTSPKEKKIDRRRQRRLERNER
jgi:hypothetical protein